MQRRKASRFDRRDFIKTAGVAGLIGLSGCSGGSGGGGGDDSGSGSDSGDDSSSDDSSEDNDGDGSAEQLILSTHTSGSAAYAASQGISTVINQNSDQVNLEARPSQGTGPNVGRLENGEAQMVYIDSWIRSQIAQGQDPFGDLSFQPYQAFHVYTLPWFLVSNTEEVQSLSDIDSDTKVYTGPAGGGSEALIEYCLDQYTDGYDNRDVEVTNQGSALSEGRIDVGVANIINYSIQPGWLQDMKASADLGVLSIPDDAQLLREDSSVNITPLDFSEFDGYDLFSMPSTINSMTMSFNTILRDDYRYDPVYNMLETMYEQRENLGEYHALLNFHADADFWVNSMYEGMPFHPAAADFYKEVGVWNDEWTVGEIS